MDKWMSTMTWTEVWTEVWMHGCVEGCVGATNLHLEDAAIQHLHDARVGGVNVWRCGCM